MNKHLSSCISKISDGYKRKRKSVEVVSNKSVIQFLDFLVKEGYIFTYRGVSYFRLGSKLTSFKVVEVFLKNSMGVKSNKHILDNSFVSTHDTYRPLFRIDCMSASSFNVYVSVKELKKRFAHPTVKYILSSKVGFILSENAIKYNLGGKIVAKVYT